MGLLIGAVILFLGLVVESVLHRYRVNRSVAFATAGSRFQIYRNRQWHSFFVKGATLGLGIQSGETVATKGAYANWLKQVAAMNANVVTVYTILPPAFYQAFYEYNLLTTRPIYLLHGIMLGEAVVQAFEDAYDEQLTEAFYREIDRTIDVIHGRAVINPGVGQVAGTYSFNTSHYVMGYIISDEIRAGFVTATNRENTYFTGLEGDYLYTENAAPFEAWLAAMGNHAISYEVNRYGGRQKLIGWTTWAGNNPTFNMDGNVNLEHIHPKEQFNAGIFASYHIYPYHLEMMRLYSNPENQEGNRISMTPFRVYLRDINTHHTIPVMVTEWAYPVFRSGSTGRTVFPDRAEVMASMFDSIVGAGITGGLVFDWEEKQELYRVLQAKFADH